MSAHTLEKIGTRHTDTQWKAKGGEGREQKNATRSTHNAPTSCSTDNQVRQPRAQGIPCMHKHTNPTDQLTADASSCLPG